VAVEPGAVPLLSLELLESLLRALAQLVEGAELDRVGRTGLRAGRFVAALEPVVAEGAFPDPAVLLLAELEAEDLDRRISGVARQVAPVQDAEGARRNAVAAAVADVLLHDHGAVLGAEQRSGRADV
jgi:hypothetical protein